jgi:hypothetical protein
MKGAKVKHLVLATPKGDWPDPPTIDGTPPFHGDEVHHPVHGACRYSYSDWVDDDGRWVDPTLTGAGTRRDTTRGHWLAHITTEKGVHRCPIDQLTRSPSSASTAT